MIVGVPLEIAEGERRVALTPDAVGALAGSGLEVVVQAGAGAEAGFPDADYEAAGARVEADAGIVLGSALVLKVQAPCARADGGHEIDDLSRGAALASFLRPLDDPGLAKQLADAGITAFSMELIPRITRAQSMDALSAMSTVAGYRAVILAAGALPKIFPMMVTAAGTIQPSRVFVIGAGVAGLQAIATARRLGAVVEAYDTRSAVAEQVQSVGARFVELDLDAGDAEDTGGYARAPILGLNESETERVRAILDRLDLLETAA